MKQLFTTKDIVSSNRILYTPSTFARSSLLYLQEIGSLQAIAPHTSRRFNLPSYLFFTVTSGSGTLSYNNRTFSLSTGSCVFIDCRREYSHSTTPDNLWSLKWIHFDGPTAPAIYKKYCERGGRPVFEPNDLEQMEAVWSDLMSIAGSADYIRDMKINSSLSELLVLIMSESWHPEEQKFIRHSVLEDVKNWIDENYAAPITLDDLASRFFINKYHLSKTFKEQFGVTLQHYVQNVRITKAKQLLRFTDNTIEEIGNECGYEDGTYFSRKFKEVEGVSPSVYRKQW